MFYYPINAAHIHLVLNHIPIILLGLCVVLLIFGLVGGNREVLKVSLWILIMAAIIIIPVYLSGGPTARSVFGTPGLNTWIIRTHAMFASLTYTLTLALGVLSAATLYLNRKKPERWYMFYYLVLITTIIASALATITGYYGGSIRHTEIYSTGSVVGSGSTNTGKAR